MKNLETKKPVQYTSLGRLIKKLLKLNIVKHLCFSLGLRGFNRVGWEQVRNGKVIKRGFTYNDRVDAGAALSSSLLAGEALGGITSPAAPKYIALSTSTLTPAKTDTTLTGETSVSGLARAVGTIQNYTAPTTLDGACSYEVYKAFTNAGATTTIKSAALFDAATGGNMFVEANLSSDATLESGDLIRVNWEVNL